MVASIDNTKLRESLTNDGFIKFSLFSETALNELKNKILNINIDNNKDSLVYHVTLLSSNKEYKSAVKNLLNPLLNNIIKSIFAGHEVILSNLIIKNPNCSEVPLHQNWTFVDESKEHSYTIWIPLSDTTETNGTLEFIAGSHRLFNDVKRGHNTPYFFMKENEQLKKYLLPVNVKAGEALLFDDAILHYSKPNLSTTARIAIQAIIIPKSAKLFHYHFEKSFFYNKLYKLPVTVDFYDDFKIQIDKTIPHNRFIKRKITQKEWEQMELFYKLHRQNSQ